MGGMGSLCSTVHEWARPGGQHVSVIDTSHTMGYAEDGGQQVNDDNKNNH